MGFARGKSLLTMVSEGARRAFSYRGAGKVRRRIRRLVRSRLFNNVRTATRNLDLPLAIATPPTGSPALCRDRNDSGSVWRQQGGPLSPLGHSGRLRRRRKHRSFRNTCAVTKRSRDPDAASIAHTQCRPEAPRALHRACWATKCIPNAVGLAAPLPGGLPGVTLLPSVATAIANVEALRARADAKAARSSRSYRLPGKRV